MRLHPQPMIHVRIHVGRVAEVMSCRAVFSKDFDSLSFLVTIFPAWSIKKLLNVMLDNFSVSKF